LFPESLFKITISNLKWFVFKKQKCVKSELSLGRIRSSLQQSLFGNFRAFEKEMNENQSKRSFAPEGSRKSYGLM